MNANDLQHKRAAARRTAWLLGLVVLVIFGTFLMTGIVGKG